MNYYKSYENMLIKLSFRYEAECPLKNHYHQPYRIVAVEELYDRVES